MSDLKPLPLIGPRRVLVTSDPEAFSRLFREGELATGKVISQIDPRHAILRFKGHHLLVETTIPLAEQEERRFRIETTSPRVTLKLLPEGVKEDLPADWIKKYLACDIRGKDLTEELSGLWKTEAGSLPSEIRETVQHLLKLLRTFAPEQLPDDPAALKALAARSGLFLESRLARHLEGGSKGPVEAIRNDDLKALLLELRERLNSSVNEKSSLIDELGKAVEHGLKKIELFQLLNLTQSGPEEKWLLLLPFWFLNHPQFLELNISLPRGEAEAEQKGESASVLFLLDLPGLGRVRIDLKMRGKGVYCLFEVYDAQASRFLEPLLPELKARLSGLGFDPYLQVATEPPREEVSLIGEVREDLKSLLSVIV